MSYEFSKLPTGEAQTEHEEVMEMLIDIQGRLESLERNQEEIIEKLCNLSLPGDDYSITDTP